MAAIGRLNANAKEVDIEWKIRNFSSFRTEIAKYCSSPAFHFANSSWCIHIYPNGVTADSRGFISLYVCRETFGRPVSLEWSIGLKSSDGKICEEKHSINVFKKKQKCWGYEKFLSRSVLLERESELTPSDVLTVTLFCTVTDTNSSKYASDNETAECSYSEESLDSKETSSQEKTCTNKPIRCPECSNIVVLEKCNEHEYQITRTDGTQTGDDRSLARDYKKILLNGKNHDLILKIGDKELRAHKDILRARSHVFESMLDHDMKEKSSGVIDVPDCDPQAMEMFLKYVYCGKAEDLDQNTMLGLYYIADKYDTQGLKQDCCELIKKSLSTTNICDVIQLALNHSDSDLLEYATEYFMENALDIMITVEWQSFLMNNSTLGNELLIKSFQKVKNVKK